MKFPGKIKLVIGPPIENISSSAEVAKQTEGWAREKLNEIRLKGN